MNKAILLCCLAILLISCKANNDKQMTWTDTKTGKEGPVPKELQAPLERIAKKQSKGLDSAIVKVNRAYNYNGYSYLKPIEGAKLVAVDVEFSEYNEEFDVDDIDILDGDSGENYGSDPHITLLTSSGEIELDETKWPNVPAPLRVLLIYAMPKKS